MTEPQTLAKQIRALDLHIANDFNNGWNAALKRAAALADATTPAEHFDDHAVRQFSKMMAEKMAASRAKGRSGWDDPNQCSVEHLQALLHEHVAKGDPVDVANICMMLRHYEASTATTPVVGAEHACGVRQAVPEWGTSDKAQHYAAMVTDTNDADILRAAISDLCRDNERLAVMLKSAKQPDPTPPTALSGPPKDGRMLCLLVDYSDGDHPLEDAKQAWTIGYNTLADTGDDEWLIAGWSWEQDCYTDGRGTVIGWLPFPCDPTPALGWNAMQTAAAQMQDDIADVYAASGDTAKEDEYRTIGQYIRALPGPTDADLDREALNRPVVQAMRTALQTLRNLMCEAFEDDDGNSGCGLCENDCTGCIAHFALAKIVEAK